MFLVHCVCRFLYALFKKVWLGSRKKGCQVVCSCCGWAWQSLLETGKNYSENKWVCSAQKNFCSEDKKLRDIARKDSLTQEKSSKWGATNISSNWKINCKRDKDTVTGEGVEERRKEDGGETFQIFNLVPLRSLFFFYLCDVA